MATVKVNEDVRDAWGQDLIDAFDFADPAAGYLEYRTGSMPNDGPGAAATGTLLATCAFSIPSATVTAGVVTFEAITEDSEADDTGTAGHARIYDGADTAIMDVDVGGAAADTVIRLSPSASITAGQPVSVTSFTITLPLTSTWTRT